MKFLLVKIKFHTYVAHNSSTYLTHAELAENGVVLCLPWRAPRWSIETWSEKEMIAWGPCIPPPTLETFSKKLACQLVPVSRYIVGLLKKKNKNMKNKMKKKMTGDS